ncbi:protein bicaudal D homolog 1 isoform X10 [Lithobates pipiens]
MAAEEIPQTVEEYKAEIERLTKELSETTQEKIQAAEYGLVVLEEKLSLKQQYDELEAEYDTLKQELEQLKEAFGQSFTVHRKVAEDGETREETLLQESATKEEYYLGRILEMQIDVRQSKTIIGNVQGENERLTALVQDLKERKKLKPQRGPNTTKRKLYLWEKKDINFVLEPCCTTTQLPVKMTQCRIAKSALVRKGDKSFRG